MGTPVQYLARSASCLQGFSHQPAAGSWVIGGAFNMAPMEYIFVVLMLTAVSAKPTAEETQTQAEDPLVVGDSEVPSYSSPGMPPFGMPPGGMPGMPSMPGGMPGMPSMPGGPAWGPNSDQFKMMQSRLAALKKKFDNLNETEKEALEEKAKAFREKMEGDAKAFKEKNGRGYEEYATTSPSTPLPSSSDVPSLSLHGRWCR